MGTEKIRGTEKEFGYEWAYYREIIPLHKEQFLSWINPVPLEFFKGKKFLDAGCGIGRNSLWPMRAGAAAGYAFDFDERTVEVARFNLQDFPQCQVAHQSIYELKFHNEFDIVFCIAVLHHLADPRLAVENLVRALKPGGTLILWVYGYEGNERYVPWLNMVRSVTSRFPPRITQLIAVFATMILKVYLALPHRKPYLQAMRKRSFRHIEAIVFDQLLPSIAHYWRKDEVMDLVKGLPVSVKHLTHTLGVSWTLVGEKTIGDS